MRIVMVVNDVVSSFSVLNLAGGASVPRGELQAAKIKDTMVSKLMSNKCPPLLFSVIVESYEFLLFTILDTSSDNL